MLKYFIEFKNRFFLIIFSCVLSTFAGYTYKEVIIFFISQSSMLSLKNFNYFIFTNVTEILYTHLQILTFMEAQIFLIYSMYNLIIFLCPALFKNEYLFAVFSLKLSFFVWLVTSLCFNFYMTPTTVSFFFSFQEFIHFNLYLEAKLNEFLDIYFLFYYFVVLYAQVFVLLFSVFFHLNLKHKKVQKFRKTCHYFLFLLGGFMTPSDFFIQFPASFFLIIFFECLFFLACLKNYYFNSFLKDYIA